MIQINRGDWCWFSNNNDHIPILAQFDIAIEEVKKPYDVTPYKQLSYKAIGAGYRYKYCEPFVGNLPTIMNQNVQYQTSWSNACLN